jgi:hypothetical protein
VDVSSSQPSSTSCGNSLEASALICNKPTPFVSNDFFLDNKLLDDEEEADISRSRGGTEVPVTRLGKPGPALGWDTFGLGANLILSDDDNVSPWSLPSALEDLKVGFDSSLAPANLYTNI